MADSTVNIDHTEEEIQGQPQSAGRDPHDGTVKVRETFVTTDRVILDPNDELAVQVPEGVGASSVDRANPLGDSLSSGTPEEQFGNDPVIESTVSADEVDEVQTSKKDDDKKSAKPAEKS